MQSTSIKTTTFVIPFLRDYNKNEITNYLDTCVNKEEIRKKIKELDAFYVNQNYDNITAK